MKAVQVVYLFLFVGIVVYIVKSTHLLEGFQDSDPASPILGRSDPEIPKGLKQDNLETRAKPNPIDPGALPFGPYAQTASVGAYQYKDPAQVPAVVKQLRQLYDDIQTFLVFEGVSISDSSDPSVSLPLTQLRADAERLHQELAVTEKNPGVESTLMQEDLANMQGGLIFLQRKVRLFQTSGVISDEKEGFMGAPPPKAKLRATKSELQTLSTKITAAILILSASTTTDPTVKARIKNLQNMYSSVSEMIKKLEDGTWTQQDVPLFSDDIRKIIPNLANVRSTIPDITKESTSSSGYKLNPLEKQIAKLVGESNARDVFNKFKDNGTFRISLDMGYNVTGTGSQNTVNIKKDIGLNKAGSLDFVNDNRAKTGSSLSVDGPYDSTMSGADDRAAAAANRMNVNENKVNAPSHLDWKERAKGICNQVKARGLDPLDFGCIPEGSKLSPAYSWRGHTKMVCGRLGSTMDASLPQTCGCPPPNWKGWTLPACLSVPASMGTLSKNACIV
jgi:hypothetical protein